MSSIGFGFTGSGYPYSNGSILDAFGRLRISSPTTLYDTQNQYNDSPLFIENVLTGSATTSHLPNEASALLSLTTASGDKVVKQTREYFRYVPGKSLLIVMSRVLGAVKTNVRQRIGYFDNNNGIYFEANGIDFGVVLRSFVSGSVVNTRVSQSNFNIDKLDGTGLSGMIIDISKANIYFIDLQWLGVGRIRMGVDSPTGQVVYCHEFRNANINGGSYMTTANLPLRTEFENTGTTSSSTTMKSICSAVIIEDSATNAKGINTAISNGITTKGITTRAAILSIRPKATFNSIINRGKIDNVSFTIYGSANSYFEVIYNPTLGGSPSWNSVGTSSIVEFDIAGTTITGGILLTAGYIPAAASATGVTIGNLLSKLPLTLDVSGANPIILTIAGTSFSGTSNMSATFNWEEIY